MQNVNKACPKIQHRGESPNDYNRNLNLRLSLDLLLRPQLMSCSARLPPPRLNLPCLGHSTQMSRRQHIKLILIPIQVPVHEPKHHSTDERQHGHDSVVPNQQRVCGEGDESLANGGREGAHEQVDGHDQGTHVLRCLGKGILEGGDGGQDFGDGNEDVGPSLCPDVDADNNGVSVCVGAGGGLVAAGGLPVDVLLDDARPDHGGGAGEEAEGDLLDGAEVYAGLAKGRIDEQIDDWDENYKGERVEVGEDVVREAVQGHYGGLRG